MSGLPFVGKFVLMLDSGRNADQSMPVEAVCGWRFDSADVGTVARFKYSQDEWGVVPSRKRRGFTPFGGFRGWLRDRVADQLIAKAYDENRSWY